MAIKHGQILTVGNTFVVDRIQTSGPGNLNIPQERIQELGNFNTVATIRDIPDLSYDLESLDVTTDIEAILLGLDPGTVVDGDEIDFANAVPLNVISPFKASQTPQLYNVVDGVAIPYLTLENVTYRFGLRANAAQTFTLRGDSVFYIPGTPYQEEFAYAAGGVYTLTHAALPYTEAGNTFHVLAVDYIAPDGEFGRLFNPQDYTDTTTTFTVVAGRIPAGSRVRATYGSAVAATYPQSVNAPADAVKPAAVRGKDIDIYLGPIAGALTRWTSVQSFEGTRRVNLQNDEEFGNYHYVATDYDTAEVSGNLVVRPRNPQDLLAKVAEIADAGAGEVVGATSSVPLQMEARVRHPDTGDVLKTIYVPDARFNLPAFQGRVNQRHDITFPYASDEGLMYVYKGERTP